MARRRDGCRGGGRLGWEAADASLLRLVLAAIPTRALPGPAAEFPIFPVPDLTSRSSYGRVCPAFLVKKQHRPICPNLLLQYVLRLLLPRPTGVDAPSEMGPPVDALGARDGGGADGHAEPVQLRDGRVFVCPSNLLHVPHKWVSYCI